MNPAKREFLLYLEDMLLSMDRIDEYIKGLNFIEFKKSYMVIDAVIRNFEIIDEASKKFLLKFNKNIRKYLGKKCMD